MSVATARRAPAGARLTYRGGADGLGDPEATLTDCPCCGQAVRVELHDDRLGLRCFGGCPAREVFARLDVPRIAAELRGAGR